MTHFKKQINCQYIYSRSSLFFEKKGTMASVRILSNDFSRRLVTSRPGVGTVVFGGGVRTSASLTMLPKTSYQRLFQLPTAAPSRLLSHLDRSSIVASRKGMGLSTNSWTVPYHTTRDSSLSFSSKVSRCSSCIYFLYGVSTNLSKKNDLIF